MYTRRTFFLTIFFITMSCRMALAGPATITVDCSRPGPRVNPHMYGIFFEELNHAGDGGLYAEMIRNRSFEDGNIPEGMHVQEGFAMTEPYRKKIAWPADKDPVPGWSTIARPGTEIAVALDEDKPLNNAQLHALRLDIKQASPKKLAGVRNAGYWGVSVISGENYNLTLYARSAQGFDGKLTAVLEDADGKPLCKMAGIGRVGRDWKKYTAVLTAKATSHQARLAIYVDSPGTVWLDVVSLFPRNTYRNRPNGLRPDLVALLKDLRPGFVRFPGGCITEGLTLEQGYDWKKTVGPIEQRPGVWNSMWGYRRSDGLGYHELLQLCEDIGAAPMYCLNVGVACTIHSPGLSCPMSEMQKYVDDALDAISYANDPTGTKWGDVRSAGGHSKPFNIKFINIGNELKGEAYAERYPLFYNAIKKKYPDITTIAYAGIGGSEAPIEIIDVHDYRDDLWFISQMDRFDAYDRSKPKISSTELAARNQTNGTLNNALLEAAYMLGLERNADVVQMVSYAPLFINLSQRDTWQPCLIHFDNHQSYGTPSYYVQKLFMANRPDVVLHTETKITRQRMIAPGKVGVGTADTEAEFTDISLTWDAENAFTGGSLQTTDLLTSGGKWTADGGKIAQSEKKGAFTAFISRQRLSDCRFAFKARKVSGNNGFRLLVGSFYGYDNIEIALGDGGNRRHRILWNKYTPGKEVEGNIEEGRWYDVAAEIKEGTLSCWLDGKLILQDQIPVLPAVYALAGKDEKTNEVIIKAVNLTSEPQPVTIDLQGTSQVATKASVTVLTSENPLDSNMFDAPTKVSPTTETIAVVGSAVSMDLTKHSFTIIRVPVGDAAQ